MSVDDELHFWLGYANQSRKKSEQDRAKAFIEMFDPLAKALRYGS